MGSVKVTAPAPKTRVRDAAPTPADTQHGAIRVTVVAEVRRFISVCLRAVAKKRKLLKGRYLAHIAAIHISVAHIDIRHSRILAGIFRGVKADIHLLVNKIDAVAPFVDISPEVLNAAILAGVETVRIAGVAPTFVVCVPRAACSF